MATKKSKSSTVSNRRLSKTHKRVSRESKGFKLTPTEGYVIADKQTGKWKRFDFYFSKKEITDYVVKPTEKVIKVKVVEFIR